MTTQQIISVVAALFGIGAYIPYIHGILIGKTKPHAFSWFLWFLMSAIVCVAQYSAGAGAGAWITASIALLCLVIFILTLKQGDKNIARSDWLALIAALFALGLWQWTAEPLWAVTILCVVYILAFYPTIRKSWDQPFQERIFSFALGSIRSIMNLFALETVNVTTTLYPLVNLATCILFVLIVLWRRQKILSP